MSIPKNSNENEHPNFNDYIKWIDELVLKFGVEIDVFAWNEIKKELVLKGE